MLAVLGAAGCSGASAPAPGPAVASPGSPAACSTPVSPAQVGARGSQTSSDRTSLKDGESLTGVRVPSLDITGSHVTVRDVRVDGQVVVHSDDVLLDHVTVQGVAISSASDVTVQFADIAQGADDGIHVTSDAGRRVSRITLSQNYIHDPRVSADAHYDGTQIRGADGVLIQCSVYDPGAYQDPFNAAVYVENANGGNTGVVVQHNLLRGFGFVFMIDSPGTTLRDNIIGGQPHWGVCDLADEVPPASLVTSGNVDERTQQPEAVCQSH